MLRTVSAIAAAAFIAATAMLLPAVMPEAAAEADSAAACDRQGWPYYDADCLRGGHDDAGRVPPVRMITTDRVSLTRAAAPAPEPAHMQAETPANPLAVPAWPDYLADLQVLAVR